MSKLIRAGFFRYFHSPVFYVCSALTLLLSFIFAFRISRCVELNEYCFVLETVIFAVLIAVSLGYEASGNIRNKIVKGYSKSEIYFSETIVAITLVSVYFIWFAILSFALNTVILSHIPVSLMLSCIFGFYLMAVMLTAAFVFITCAVSRQTVSAVICLSVIIVLYMTSTVADAFLSEPQYIKWAKKTENGEWEYMLEENPKYIDEPLRSILVFYRNTNPYGQRAKYEAIAEPCLYTDEDWEKARENIADTLGSAFLDRELSADEQTFLQQAPVCALIPIPFLIVAGWLVFRKKSFR